MVKIYYYITMRKARLKSRVHGTEFFINQAPWMWGFNPALLIN
jgi:hypothetical protein